MGHAKLVSFRLIILFSYLTAPEVSARHAAAARDALAASPPAHAVQQEPASEEELADVLLSSKTEAECEQRLAAGVKFITARLRQALMTRGDQATAQRNYERASTAYELARDVAERLGDRGGLAAALFGSGTVKRMEGKYAAAEADLIESLRAYEALGDQSNTATVLNGLGIVNYMRGDYERALEHYRRSLGLWEALGNRASVANAQKNIGMVSREQGNYAQAMQFNLKSLAISEQLGDKEKVADMLNNIGVIHDLQGDYAEALVHYGKSIELYDALRKTTGALMVLNNIGIVYEHQGNYTPALAAYQKVLEARKAQGDKTNVAIALNNLGNIYSLQGNFAQALEHYQQALALIEPSGNKARTASILNNIGGIYRLQGRYEEALSYIARSLSLNEALGVKRGVAEALTNMGDVRLLQADYAQARGYYLRAQLLYEELGDKRGISQLLNNFSLVSQSQGRHAEALEHARRAAAISQQIGSNGTLWKALVMEGGAYRALGDTASAMRSLKQAIDVIELMRAEVAGGEQEQQFFFEDKLSPYHAMIELLLAEGSAADALTYAENAKGRTLLDVIRRGRLNVTKSMTTAEQARELQLKNALVSLGTQLRKESESPTPDRSKLDALDTGLKQARLEYEAFQVGVYAAQPTLKALRGSAKPSGLSEADLLRLLDGDSALLEYVVTEKKVYLFVLSGSGGVGEPSLDTRAYELGVERKELGERVETFRRQVAGRDGNFLQQARALYDLLLGPALGQLRGKRSLVIVPDSVLWELPYQALQAGDHRYLLEQYALSYAPSLSVLYKMTESAAEGGGLRGAPTLLAFGNPLAGGAKTPASALVQRRETFTSLPEAEREVRTLAQIYGDGRATVFVGAGAAESRFKAEAGRYNLLHLATHGVVNDANPMYSYVLLAGDEGSGEDGRLEAWELAQMDLKAELVVLSACETGRGRVGKGEGMIGLSWALFMAGSSLAVDSQWKVESRSTTALMLEFHRNLRRSGSPAGARMSKASALQQAALKLMKSAEYRHPFYWAGFIAVGDAR
jgi:CHAT domain-containing protein/tetratricopeptide (TPR) repeat protein